MKKIMIMALVGVCAGFANAAAVNWSATGVCDPVASAAAGKSVGGSGWLGYMILAADYDTVTTDLQMGSTASLVSKSIGGASVATSAGKFAAGTAAGDVAAGNQTFYMIVLNATDVSKATSYYSATASATVDASLDTQVLFGSQIAATKDASNWTSMGGSPVPEPTSGLLLVLGMAGLALRRRRA